MAARQNSTVNNEIEYDRSKLKTGIVHFGVGGFHRSHQARYMDKLFKMGLANDWAICGVGVIPPDRAMRDALRSSDMSYLLVERAADGTEVANRIGSITEYIYAPADKEAVFNKLADPETKLVTLTITEGGYNVDEVNGLFDLTEPAVAQDLEDPANPKTVFGLIVEGLRRRRSAGGGPVTILSCDNVQHNGQISETAFVGYANAAYPDLVPWIRENVTFPSSMVDRITPATTADHREYVASNLGVEDAWPVVAEDFTQWVVEDNFASGRPPFEKVGVQMVDDVSPYEKLKLRLLNTSHQLLGYLGYLEGHEFVHDAVADENVRRVVTDYMQQEARATLDPVPGIDVAQYAEKLLERFSNEAIADTLSRLATDGSDRIAKFVLPVQRDLIEAGLPSPRTSGIVAAWALVTEIVRTGQLPPLAKDRQFVEIARVFTVANGDPTKMVKSQVLFGNLAESPEFAERVSKEYEKLAATFPWD